jgi:hypothetical protein
MTCREFVEKRERNKYGKTTNRGTELPICGFGEYSEAF